MGPAAPTQTGLVPRTRAALGIAASAVSVGAGFLLRRRKR